MRRLLLLPLLLLLCLIWNLGTVGKSLHSHLLQLLDLGLHGLPRLLDFPRLQLVPTTPPTAITRLLILYLCCLATVWTGASDWETRRRLWQGPIELGKPVAGQRQRLKVGSLNLGQHLPSLSDPLCTSSCEALELTDQSGSLQRPNISGSSHLSREPQEIVPFLPIPGRGQGLLRSLWH